MDEPKFYRASTVCKVLGIKPITLRQWHLRNLFQLEADEAEEIAELIESTRGKLPEKLARILDGIAAAKKRGWRIYSVRDILCLAVLHRLTLLGLTTERAAQFANRIAFSPDPRKEKSFRVIMRPKAEHLAEIESANNDQLAAQRERQLFDQSMVTWWEEKGDLSDEFKIPSQEKMVDYGHARDMGVVVNLPLLFKDVLDALDALSKEPESRATGEKE